MMTLRHVSAEMLQIIRADIIGRIARFEQVLLTLPDEYATAPELDGLRADLEQRRARLALLDHVIARRGVTERDIARRRAQRQLLDHVVARRAKLQVRRSR